MLRTRIHRSCVAFSLRLLLRLPALVLPRAHAQAALLLEEPYGTFGSLNPTGHAALYLRQVCAETPVRLRPCRPDESGVVLSRYKDMAGYDWVAIPLFPYLYAVETQDQVPLIADSLTVRAMRSRYREQHLGEFGAQLRPGGFFHGGWEQLVGAAYNRRIFAFRFPTTPQQDAQLIRTLNANSNRSRFNLLFNNCADFNRFLLSNYFPGQFPRNAFPDLWMTTPKFVSHRLVRTLRNTPGTSLQLFEIPQIPGSHHASHSAHGIAESLLKSGYIVPITLLNPYLAGGLLADYFARGRYHLLPGETTQLAPETLTLLTGVTTPPDGSSTASALPPSPSTALFPEPAPVPPQPISSPAGWSTIPNAGERSSGIPVNQTRQN
jgi:hypothetical protein